MIVIYSTPTCGRCHQLKAFCTKNNIAFENIDINTDFKARAKLLSLNLMELPVVEYNNELLTGSFKEIQDILQKSVD